MSFTTRCPACGTVFRVVADQLKISDGWVRCGHCSDVFDATIHLEAWVPSAAAPAASADAAPAAPASAPVPAPTAMVEPAVPPPPVPEPTLPDAADDMPAPPAQPPEDDDLRAWDRQQQNQSLGKRFCQERARELNLEMKISRVDFPLYQGQATFYFTAEGRVDIARAKPIARLGYSLYAAVTETFRMTRPD